MRALAIILPLALAFPAAAEVKASAINGFEVARSVTVKAPPNKLFDALFRPAKWWNPEHSYSKTAGNLSLDRRVGGCFCEKLAGGGRVEHLRVVYLAPDEVLGLQGALGPLAGEGAIGTLYLRLKPAPSGTLLTLSYTVGGYLHDDGAKWATAVDAVLGEQLDRLAHYVETGAP
jgi:uncharacterized protein YndB with AHSA1/START domain